MACIIPLCDPEVKFNDPSAGHLNNGAPLLHVLYLPHICQGRLSFEHYGDILVMTPKPEGSPRNPEFHQLMALKDTTGFDSLGL